MGHSNGGADAAGADAEGLEDEDSDVDIDGKDLTVDEWLRRYGANAAAEYQNREQKKQ